MRVVSLVPSFTETIFSLGGATVVGVTSWCIHPVERVDSVQKVGGTKDPDVDAIVALRPDVVIGNREENRREDVEALQAAGLRVVLVDVETVDEAPHAVRVIGEAVGEESAAEGLARRLEDVVRRTRAFAEGKPRVRVFVPIWRRPWRTIGGDTFAHSVLDAAGAVNVFGDESRYPEATPEAARARGAQAALLPSEPYPFAVKHVPEVVDAGFPRDAVRLVDGESLTWYGVRMLTGLADIASGVDEARRAVT